MRVLWMLIKIIVGLAIAIPLGVLALALTLGLVGTLVGIAILVLKLACVGLVGYGLYRVARLAFGPSPSKNRRTPTASLANSFALTVRIGGPGGCPDSWAVSRPSPVRPTVKIAPFSS